MTAKSTICFWVWHGGPLLLLLLAMPFIIMLPWLLFNLEGEVRDPLHLAVGLSALIWTFGTMFGTIAFIVARFFWALDQFQELKKWHEQGVTTMRIVRPGGRR